MEASTGGEASASCSVGPSTSAAAADAGATHYLAKRVLRGSAVLHVVEGRFRSPDSVDVVLGKVRPPALLPLVT
jgi:splicing factor 3B subunit 3